MKVNTVTLLTDCVARAVFFCLRMHVLARGVLRHPQQPVERGLFERSRSAVPNLFCPMDRFNV